MFKGIRRIKELEKILLERETECRKLGNKVREVEGLLRVAQYDLSFYRKEGDISPKQAIFYRDHYQVVANRLAEYEQKEKLRWLSAARID